MRQRHSYGIATAWPIVVCISIRRRPPLWSGTDRRANARRGPEPGRRKLVYTRPRHNTFGKSGQSKSQRSCMLCASRRGQSSLELPFHFIILPLRPKCPAGEAGQLGNGMRIQSAQSFERQGRRPSALRHDGRRRWIFAKRSLADRSLADRRRRRRRLPYGYIGRGGSAQHRQGCSQCS